MKRIAVFGSGSGSNAENIYNYFKRSNVAKVVLFYCNKKSAYLVERGKNLNVPLVFITKDSLENYNETLNNLKKNQIDYLVLAGFLLKIPIGIVERYQNKIINIHPSLLPLYGGKGMYGKNIHRAILKNNEHESGITIHLVNQNYDDGKILLQKKCIVSKNETLISLEKKIRKLEFKYYPQEIKKLILKHG